jgi:hypothetical protein
VGAAAGGIAASQRTDDPAEGFKIGLNVGAKAGLVVGATVGAWFAAPFWGGAYLWSGVVTFDIATIHWNRNLFNAPASFEDARRNWRELPANKSIFHRMGPGNEQNRKFVSPVGFHEVVFKPTGELVTDPLNEGTFNYFPENWAAGIPHGLFDVLPYFILGNSPYDWFTLDRFQAPFNSQNPGPPPQEAGPGACRENGAEPMPSYSMWNGSQPGQMQ